MVELGVDGEREGLRDALERAGEDDRRPELAQAAGERDGRRSSEPADRQWQGDPAEDAARPYATTAARNSESWKAWRDSDEWKKWSEAISPSVKARRRIVRMVGDKQATRVLFSTIAPRFTGRTGGYTRIIRLAKPRLGDAGTRAILEFVGVRDRVSQKMQAPKVEAATT